MLSINNIVRTINDIEYGWNKPSSYSVIIPGLSLLIKNVQIADFKNSAHSPKVFDKCVSMFKWHLGGSIAQWLVSAWLICVVAHPIFIGLALLAFCQFCSILCETMAFTVVRTDQGKTSIYSVFSEIFGLYP